jgi:hypothetical protein
LINIPTTFRSNEEEIMDDFDLQGDDLKFVLKDIDNVNRRLGGHHITIKGIKKLLRSSDQKAITIADIGCGSGQTLRQLSKWGKGQNRSLKLYGIDANAHIIEQAKALSKGYDNINYVQKNIFSEEFKSQHFDIITCCLTLHHFKDEEILKLISLLYAQSGIGVVVNDLHRSKLAYVLFKLYSTLFMKSKIAKNDGGVSILRGFKKNDLLSYGERIKLNNFELKWHWAFRYLWILKK